MAKTILVRLLIGLLGYAGLCIWLPFQPDHLRLLLGTAVGMGLFSGLAFSASYQLVSRFANKNVIALGLGCSASAPLVLLLEIGFGIGTHATRSEQVLLYGSVGLLVLAGTAAAVSLLFRHWEAIEQHAAASSSITTTSGGSKRNKNNEAGKPLLEAATLDHPPTSIATSAAASSPRDITTGHSPGDGASLESGSTPLPPPLIAYGSLEPYRTFLSTDEEVVDPDGSFHGPTSRELSRLESRRSFRFGSAELSSTDLEGGAAAEPLLHAQDSTEPPPISTEEVTPNRVTLVVLSLIWAPMLSMFFSTGIALTVFPFFTYVRSSGLFGESFPRVR